MQHKWKLTAADGFSARWKCERCKIVKTSMNRSGNYPSITYRTASGNKAVWSVLSKAPPCPQFNGESEHD